MNTVLAAKDDILRQYTRLSMFQKSMLLAMGVLLITAAYLQLVYQKSYAQLQTTQQQLQTQEIILQEIQGYIHSNPDQTAFQKELLQKQQLVNTLLPADDAMPGLLQTMDKLAKEQKVKIVAVKQGTFIEKSGYYEIPLDINLKCTYNDLLAFIRKMESLSRFNTITKIAVQPEQNMLNVQLSTSVFVFGPLPQKSLSQPNKK